MLNQMFYLRLSRKLLLLTITFVMLAELVIFVPSAALFRQNWLQERIEKVRLISYALTSVDVEMPKTAVTDQFVYETDVVRLSVMQRDKVIFVYGYIPAREAHFQLVDMTKTTRLPSLKAAFTSFFGRSDGYLRVQAQTHFQPEQLMELIIPRGKLKWAMWDYFERIFLLSLAIAFMTGGLIYFAMFWLIVRPICQLVQDLKTFRENPQMRHVRAKMNRRKDEIGELQQAFLDMRESVYAALRQRERLALLGISVAKINHDLRNIFSAAYMISDRLLAETETRVMKIGERLNRVIERGLKLTMELLEFSQPKKDSHYFRAVRISFLLGEVAGDVLGAFSWGGRLITFNNQVGVHVNVYADAENCYRIFHNLFRNAGQAMTLMNDENNPRELTVTAQKAGDMLKIKVSDTGAGIPDPIRANLFQMFNHTEQAGRTGLGLTICKELAEAMGGSLELDSTGLDGTCFVVTLPIV